MHTSMNYVIPVQVADRFKHLSNGLRGISFGKLAILANPIKQLPASGKLSDDIVLVLHAIQPSTVAET